MHNAVGVENPINVNPPFFSDQPRATIMKMKSVSPKFHRLVDISTRTASRLNKNVNNISTSRNDENTSTAINRFSMMNLNRNISEGVM